ncbi:VOC family protein [Polynucleobacter paneuropaeus]|jgi:catechol 2,3-dioxygenase-like lactoylglutathione lyase family enzyme|nr:VOC family protein [Polynucleobacter paneuropaeus]
MISQIRHTGLVVADLEAALSFWRDLLGFKIDKQMDESGPHIDAMMGMKNVEVTTVKMSAPQGGVIELLHFKSHPDDKVWQGKPYSTGFTHIALAVKDLDDCYQKLAEAGCSFPARPQYSPDGAVKVIYCKGLDGVLLELVEILNRIEA